MLDIEKNAEDLQWVVTHYRLQPNDPVFLLVAWHWNRMKACEDILSTFFSNTRSSAAGTPRIRF